jgi:arsenate reductase
MVPQLKEITMSDDHVITIYHNARCSKSRAALALTQIFSDQQQLILKVVEYLNTPPTPAQLTRLQQQLGTSLRTMMRSQEQEYEALHLAEADDATLLQAIANSPQLLQRPIVVWRNAAMIGRSAPDLQAWLTARTTSNHIEIPIDESH